MRWRRLFRALHRDIGFAVAALLLAYSISGLAVNHIEDWNPNYTFEQRSIEVKGLSRGNYTAMQAEIVKALDLNPQRVRGHFMQTETDFRVYLEDGEEVRINVDTGKGAYKKVTTRAGLYEVNSLHLNSIKGWWTWVADVFAVTLIILVITGVFMMKGDRGVTGRGKYFLLAGFLVPALFIVFIVWGA